MLQAKLSSKFQLSIPKAMREYRDREERNAG
jgi:bifunctional DNA-binding transcriptional regulator/antitoxin component of YhaV-PrlF toxin-antitoxin module